MMGVLGTQGGFALALFQGWGVQFQLSCSRGTNGTSYLHHFYKQFRFSVDHLCLLHILILHGISPQVLPHTEVIKILFGNCFIQPLMYCLMMDPSGTKHVYLYCF